MSDTPNKTAEKPVNDGGNAPQEPQPTDEQVAAETPVNQGGGSD